MPMPREMLGLLVALWTEMNHLLAPENKRIQENKNIPDARAAGGG
jgi:hypothetical protein